MPRINEVKYLFHGTGQEFDTFDLSKAQGFKDFGKGFYLTTNLAQAQKWAQRKGKMSGTAYIYRYNVSAVDARQWNILELLQYDEKWVNYIRDCRLKGLETEHDIVYDRMADSRLDNISGLLQEYAMEQISAQDVIRGIKWSEKSKADQYCFKTEKALSLLKKRKKYVQRKDPAEGWKEMEWVDEQDGK